MASTAATAMEGHGQQPSQLNDELQVQEPSSTIPPPLETGQQQSGAFSSSSDSGDVKPMWQWVLGDYVLKPLGRWTVGTARVDLRRPCLPQAYQQGDNFFRIQKTERPITGARMKVMRDVALRQREGQWPPVVRVGLGAEYQLDTNSFNLQARMRVFDWGSIKALPQPMVKLQRSFKLMDSGLVAHVQYSCPFVHGLRSPLAPPARLLLRVDNHAGSGVHFSPFGVEVDEKVLALGDMASLRVAAGMAFPRQLPMTPDDELKWQIHRLGLKTRW